MSKVTFKYPVGIEVKCTITGVQGIITSRLTMLNGCIQYHIQPKCAKKSTTIPDGAYIDEQILVPVGKKGYKGEAVDFKFMPGDKLRNRLSGMVGIVRYSIHDLNNCQRVEVVGELGKDGKPPISCAIIQEFEYVSKGLNNSKKEVPVEKTFTGCATRKTSAYSRDEN